jgi:hypothetical protein
MTGSMWPRMTKKEALVSRNVNEPAYLAAHSPVNRCNEKQYRGL